MPSDGVDVGLLSPVSAGFDELCSDDAVASALVSAEVALVRAAASLDLEDRGAAERISRALAWDEPARRSRMRVDTHELALAARATGNPVVPLVHLLRARLGGDGTLLHRGATSQDIVDTALAVVAADAVRAVLESAASIERSLGRLAAEHRDTVAVARTLTQAAVPTTLGLRASTWLRGVRRATTSLRERRVPAQLGGAAGTLAALTALHGDRAALLPGALAAELGLDAPEAPWHTTRWPITELGDALVQLLDAIGVLAADIATLSRSEIGEVHEGTPGGSSTMPHKRNPVQAVLLRSAAMRAPHLAATLHTASSLAVDERPDGAWHAEWPALRELLRLALGASGTAAELLDGLQVDRAAIARNLAAAGPDLLAERERLQPGGPLDASSYLGLAGALVDDALEEHA